MAGSSHRGALFEPVFLEEFDRITDAIAAERQVKGWTRAKKEALIRRDWPALQRLAKRVSGQR